MAHRISLEPHLTVEELGVLYRSTKAPVERSHWHFPRCCRVRRTARRQAFSCLTTHASDWAKVQQQQQMSQDPSGS